MKILYVLPVFLLYSICKATYIDKLNIIGNEHTKIHIIERELHHPIPGKYDSILTAQDRDRIYNLGLFSTVEIYQLDSTYTVFVIETFPLLPIPIVEYNEASGFSFGASIIHLNLRGMNEKLSLGIITGKETIYFVNFINPWILRDHISLRGKFYQYHTQNPVYDYHYQENGFYIGTGFHKNKHHKYKLEIGAEVINLDSISNNFTSKEYKILKTKFNYQYDTRDIYIDPTKGQFLSISILPKYYLNNSELSYYRTFMHNSWYFMLSNKLNGLILSLKNAVLLQHSQLFPIFADIYLGGEDFVRGYSPIPDENKSQTDGLIQGYNVLFQSIQLQHTLFERIDYGNVELGMDMVYFVDMGIVSDKYNSFKIKNLIIGYGWGLRLFTSSIGIIRFDIGFNPYGGWNWHPSDGTNHHSDRMD